VTVAAVAALQQGLMCDSVVGSEPLRSGAPRIRIQWEVSGEVDRARAFQDEEVVEVQLHQIQGFIGVFFFFGTFRMLL
jgi:hypothetical protein